MDGIRRVYLPGGTKEKPIIYESYPNEKVIFDGSKLSRKNTQNEIWREGRLELRENYTYLRNVEVREMPQYGIKIWGNHNIVEGCKVYNNALSGIQIFNYKDGYSVKPTGGSYNIIRDNLIFNNSDTGLKHHNYNDGGNADGITVHSGVDNLIEHNTVYENSDDGIDVWKSMGSKVFSNLIYKNGQGTYGDGYGVKLGGAPKDSPLGANAVARYNISYRNRKSGFNVNGGKNVLIELNTAYNNGEYGYTLQDDTKVLQNIALANKLGDFGWSKGLEQSNNSWQLNQEIEFISLDPMSEDFLRPRDNTKYKHLGAFGTKKNKE
ncbi:MAG TPA: right-handed parallel beta-helix repeat-containing protein [Arcobacter sp.]|nr:right-handed parallel beta-helix repeat-containing protein [Arcobacter sp.]